MPRCARTFLARRRKMAYAAIGTHQAMMTLFEALVRLAGLCRDVAGSGDGGKAGETQDKGEGPGGSEGSVVGSLFPVAVAGRACMCWEGASIESGENEQDEQNDQLDHSQATQTTKRPLKDH